MSSNKKAREELEKLYGKECFIEKLHLRKDDKPRKYTGKGQMKRMKQLTYHHILEKSLGGKATVENGAILSVQNHIWFNNQSPEVQRCLNAIFQEYKKRANKCKIVFVEDLQLPYTIKPIEFKIKKKKRKYSRAKKKQEDKKIKEEYMER